MSSPINSLPGKVPLDLDEQVILQCKPPRLAYFWLILKPRLNLFIFLLLIAFLFRSFIFAHLDSALAQYNADPASDSLSLSPEHNIIAAVLALNSALAPYNIDPTNTFGLECCIIAFVLFFVILVLLLSCDSIVSKCLYVFTNKRCVLYCKKPQTLKGTPYSIPYNTIDKIEKSQNLQEMKLGVMRLIISVKDNSALKLIIVANPETAEKILALIQERTKTN